MKSTSHNTNSLKNKNNEESTNNAAPLLGSLFKNLPGMAYRCVNRKDWPMEFVSEGCFALCGYTRADIEGQKVLWGECFTFPEDIERIENAVIQAVEKGEPFEIEYRITTRDNQEKWVWERGRSVEWRDGYYILEGFITDITDRKKTEAAFMNEEAFAKAVVDTVVEAVITIDEAGRIDTINSVTQEMFGYTLNEIKGKHIQILMSKPENKEFVKYMSSHLNGDESIVAKEREENCKHKNGNIFPVHLSVREVLTDSNHNITPELNSNRKIERKFVGLFRDLTARRSAEQEAREQREQLAHVDRLNILGEMAISIAHEINQPLTAISMYAQSGIRFIDSEPSKIDRARDALNKISLQAHRAGDVIEHVQQLTKQQDSRHQEIDCNNLIRDVHKLAEVEAHLRNMRISLALSEELQKVRCDPIQIQQVILNLIRNGMEAMESSTEVNALDKNEFTESVSKIIIRTDSTEKGIKVSIIDNGEGISKEFAERLYMPFASTKESGMGMGLSISSSIVKAHNSKLDFINNKKAGVTFFFILPYVEELI